MIVIILGVFFCGVGVDLLKQQYWMIFCE
uniref:Uncharacterized protein n=1 Tax=Anguilla anguilla TaxID=7936 RepID=A0A0E9UGS7_ANGAN